MAEKKEKNLYQKLAEARAEIGVKKTGKNKFANYDYYELNEIYNQAKKIFKEKGIMTFFSMVSKNPNKQVSVTEVLDPMLDKEDKVMTDEKGNVMYKKTIQTQKDGEYEFYTAQLKIVNADNPEEVEIMTMTSTINNMKGAQPTQNTGATNTYLIKYLYMDLLMIDDSELDPDATNTHGEKEKGTKKSASEKQTKQQEKQVDEVLKDIQEKDDERLKGLVFDYSILVQDCKTIEELKKITKDFWKDNNVKSDPVASEELKKIYEEYKEDIEK